MRKCVKLVASALAAIAVVGGSSTAASADSKPIDNKPVKAKPVKDGPSGAQNVCGNDNGRPIASSKDNGTTELGDVFQGEESHQVICQIGENNYAVTYYEGDLIGGDTVYALGAVVENLTPNVAMGSRN